MTGRHNGQSFAQDGSVSAAPARTLNPSLIFAYAALALSLLRFASAMVSGLQYDRGDFYATMPPAYAEQLNPALWDNPEFAGSSVFHRRVYLYGPTQYLTIAPLIVAFDSYTTLARFLLIVYGAMAVGCALLLRKTFAAIVPLSAPAGMLIIASTLGFFPLLTAVTQREFEVVILSATAAAVYFLIKRREWIAGALFGYITWFKFLPILWLFLLAMRRWFTAIAAFAGISLLIWLAAHLWFGLGNFGTLWELAGTELTEGSAGSAVCADFSSVFLISHANSNTTYAGVRYALCRFGSWYSWFPAPALYFSLLAALLGAFLLSFWRFERRSVDASTDSWRRALEASVVIIMTSGIHYAHYYYLSLLVIVLAVLIARYSVIDNGWLRPAALAVAYFLLTAFVVPPSIMARVFGFDVFHSYMRLSLYFYGEMILIALVFSEYWRLSLAPARNV